MDNRPRDPLEVTGGEIVAWCRRHRIRRVLQEPALEHLPAATPSFVPHEKTEEWDCLFWGGTWTQVMAALGTLVLAGIGPSCPKQYLRRQEAIAAANA